MSDPDVLYLESLLQRREGRALELKEAKSGFGRDAAMRYVAALANEGGGELVLGVRESGSGPHHVVGTSAFLDTNELELHIHQTLRLNVLIREITHREGRVLVLAVPGRMPGQVIPYDGRYWARAGESLVPMDEARLRSIFAEAQGPVATRHVKDDLTAQEVEELLDTAAYFRLSGDPTPESAEERLRKLEHRGVVARSVGDTYAITVAGAVFLARDLAAFQGLEWRRTRILRFQGRDRTTAVMDSVDSRGYALQFEDTLTRITESVPVRETFEGGLRKAMPFYPEQALREFLANALVHQDFETHGSQVVVEIFSDRVEIRNPGTPLVEVERFVDETRARNPELAELMRICRMCEARGSGVDRALSSLEEFLQPMPLFRAETASTAVVLLQDRAFTDLAMDDRIWAIFIHASLRHAQGEAINNASVRARFALEDRRVTIVSQAIAAAVDQGLIKADPSAGGSLRYKRYVPFYA